MNPWATRYLSAPFYYAPLQWSVRTYDGTYAGPETVAAATLQLGQHRLRAARARRRPGRDRLDGAEARRADRQLQSTPSLALGTGAVTPLDMASAYATLAAGGVYSKPLAIRRVVFPDGKTGGGWGRPQRTQVIPDWVAATVTRVLEENMLHGTGVGAHVTGRVDAGKTGTTDDYADAWFCGYTPSLEATVWMGYPRGRDPDARRARRRRLRARPCRRRPGGCSWSVRSPAPRTRRFRAPLSPAQFAPWAGRYAYTTTSS